MVFDIFHIEFVEQKTISCSKSERLATTSETTVRMRMGSAYSWNAVGGPPRGHCDGSANAGRYSGRAAGGSAPRSRHTIVAAADLPASGRPKREHRGGWRRRDAVLYCCCCPSVRRFGFLVGGVRDPNTRPRSRIVSFETLSASVPCPRETRKIRIILVSGTIDGTGSRRVTTHRTGPPVRSGPVRSGGGKHEACLIYATQHRRCTEAFVFLRVEVTRFPIFPARFRRTIINKHYRIRSRCKRACAIERKMRLSGVKGM